MIHFSPHPDLPIYERASDIITALARSQVIIVSGETGSGKSSQLPLICFEAGFAKRGKIGITQPRRIAATSLAAYAANQCKTALGAFVGYKVRFSDRDSPATKIKYMTDGILLRELSHDRLLRAYDVLIVDEAHERSLNIDFILGYLRTILAKRPDLRLIISSATIDTELFSAAFRKAPVIPVSGRLFPVDILYKPGKEAAEDDENEPAGRADYVGAAIAAVREIVEARPDGDVLVFMPTERDIVEVKDLLDNRLEGYCAVLALFGRMPLSEQQAIFKPLDRQKIVVATNIAETSLTVPNIRYVVDCGLARVKRYDASSRITRLPVEAISQASARQRAGRCGRVMDGVCVRLYGEEDLLSRPAFTTAEIQRANLGQVILSMAALRLGTIENFPFLDQPPQRSVSQGYAQLCELGALDEDKNLTRLGGEMAALPLDPPLSRMIIEAKRQQCLCEILVIASGLCVQDMRVRPREKKQEADAAHARFTDPQSDFLFYLKLWHAAELDKKQSLSKLRKFCAAHFLSFTRMREWRDVHLQLCSLTKDYREPSGAAKTVAYDRLHRCILAGFLSNIARKTKDNDYQAAKGRKALLFPGSALYKKKPDWIVSAEIVETSRVFARTAAAIDASWCEEMGGDLCKRSYGEAWFDEESGTVKAKEKVTLFGLAIVENRTKAFGRIDPKRANEIFIEEGLVNARLRTHYKFFSHNNALKDKILQAEKKMRSALESGVDDAAREFYLKTIPEATSIHELNAKIRAAGSDLFLYMKETDLAPSLNGHDPALFPDSAIIGAATFPIRYEFDPSSIHDGATVEVPSQEVSCINETVFDWIVPGFILQRIQYLLESLPKAVKKQLEPVPHTSQTIADALTYTGEDFLDSMCEAIEQLFGVSIDASQLAIDHLPHHLSIKVAIKKSHNHPISPNAAIWQKQTAQFQKKNLQAWDFGDLPEKIEVIKAKKGFSIYGYPTLVSAKDSVDITVFLSQTEQAQNHGKGVKALLEICLSKEKAWLENDLRFGKHLQSLCIPLAKPEIFKNSLVSLIENHFLKDQNLEIRKKTDFEEILTKIKKGFIAQTPNLVAALEQFLTDFHEIQSMIKKRLINYNIVSYREMAQKTKLEMQKYVIRFLNNTLNYNMFLQYPRYISAFKYRIDRAFSDLRKYAIKHEIIRPYLEKSDAILSKLHGFSHEKQGLIIEFTMMVEEFKISTFAQQEIKTLFPISQKKLDENWEEISTFL